MWANGANAWFKRYKFLLNPIHALNMTSNLFTLKPWDTATGGLWRIADEALKNPDGKDVANAVSRRLHLSRADVPGQRLDDSEMD